MRGAAFVGIICAIAGCAPSLARAGEKATYTYDALGRLQVIQHSGQVNSSLKIEYRLDAMGNRTGVIVTGSSNMGVPQGAVIVVPLNGFTVIPVGTN